MSQVEREERTVDKVSAEVRMPNPICIPYDFEVLNELASSMIGKVIDVHSKVHGETSVDHLLEFIEHQKNLTTIVSLKEGVAVGYKIGYELKPNKYLSWMSGVDPKHRRFGIASEMMRLQHEWVKKQGYSTIRTESSNLWPAMLILNIRFGFRIVGTYTQGVPHDEPKIVFEKEL